jgi:lipoyl(octanoyl) transferase
MNDHGKSSAPAGKRDYLPTGMLPGPNAPAVTWETASGLTPYPAAVTRMEALADAIRAGSEGERVWLVEHPPLYTAGTSARDGDLADATRFPVFRSGRGGQFTYHGPGQRVVYAMLDLKRRRQDIRAYVATLEEWIIAALGEFGIAGERRDDRVGVWAPRPDKPPLAGGEPRDDKIAAIGIRIRRWVTMHGASINVAPALAHYNGIVACGITGHGVTSLADLGVAATLGDVDAALKATFPRYFGKVA